MKRVYLGGTESGSKWRDELIPLLRINYTSPVETENSKEIPSEAQERDLADFILHVITPKAESFEALDIVARAVQNSNRRPGKTVFCTLSRDEDAKFNAKGKKTLRGIMEMIQGNGAQVFDSLEGLAVYLNGFYVDPSYEADMVECLIKRDGPTEITLGSKRYTFNQNASGHYVCKVMYKEHRKYLLGLGDFRLYQQEKAPEPDFTEDEWEFIREWKTMDAGTFSAYVDRNIDKFNGSRDKIRAIAIGKWKALLPKMGCPVSPVLPESSRKVKDPEFIDEWIQLDGAKFEQYVKENEGRFRDREAEILEKAKSKWERLVFAKTGAPWPLVMETVD